MSANPDPCETAAIAAAVERFRAETAPAGGEEEAISSWQRAALAEGVEARATVLKHHEGGVKWLS